MLARKYLKTTEGEDIYVGQKTKDRSFCFCSDLTTFGETGTFSSDTAGAFQAVLKTSYILFISCCYSYFKFHFSMCI